MHRHDETHQHLSRLVEDAAAHAPEAIAVEAEDGRTWTYADLRHAADRIATRLARWGIERGDRVGLFLPKSFESVAAIHGILRAGAAYVPIDPTAPARRGAGILADAQVRAVITVEALAPELAAAWPESAPGGLPRRIVVAAGDASAALEAHDADWAEVLADEAPTPLPPPRHSDDLAYILYTSGSTGVPKGVMLSHANAYCFLDWCEAALDLRDGERFSSHAPFHFDLSVFDLYACCRHAGALVLIGESLAKDPMRLGPYLGQKRIDVWYSAPSILALMAEHGALEGPDAREPRVVLFAGEVFPVRPLKRLRTLWPSASLWNLYGPTETNVCTAYHVPATIAEDRNAPLPIGPVCPPLRARVVDEQGRDVPVGGEGELVITGAGVMRGYFGRPDLNEAAFLHDADGTAWYHTGDLVVDDGTGCFTFRGRRDRMVKKRGYRIELGEIESALYRHDDVDRAAVIARSDEQGLTIDAFIAVKPERKGSVIAMKRHCTQYLPHYMVPDRIKFIPALPTTSTDKVDYQQLKALGEQA